MNQARHVILATFAAFTLLCSACKEPAPAAPAEPAPAPVAEPVAEQAVAPAMTAEFDVRAFAGTFAGRLPCQDCRDGVDVRLDLNGDGSFRLVETNMTHPEQEPGETTGTWTAEENNTQVLLDPDSKTDADRRFDIASNNELRLHTVDKNVAAGANTSLFRLATP